MTKIIGAPTLDDALAALRAEVALREARGEKTLIFCEDRLTLLAERAVLETTGGTFLTEVSTFARFLSGEERVLSKHGSVMALTAILSDREKDLRCFRQSAAQAVYETLAQLLASRVTAEMLKESAEAAEGMLQSKLCDLALLYESYNEFLREKGLLDENGYLALLPERIANGGLGDTHVLFFAFQSFTRQGREGVRAAIGNAHSVTGIFLAGRERIYTNEGARIFRSVAEEFGEVELVQKKSSLAGEAAGLLTALFSPEPAGVRMPAGGVYRFSASDEAEEMNTVAALIRKQTAEGRRYRDIAVLVGNESYYLAAEKAFAAYHIPYYADRKRKFSEHPFCAFALSVLDAAANGALPDSVDDIASSVYFGEGSEYRNYLLKFGGYRGAVRREIKSEEALSGMDRAALVSARERILAILKLFRAKDSGTGFAKGIRALWELVGGDEITETLQQNLTAEERAFLEIGRLWEVLNETEEVAGPRIFTAREFAVLLKNGLEALEISMLPQCADAVFVGEITESRIYRSPVLFCAGLTEALPRISQDTAVITDGEIKKLETLKVEIEPAIAVVNARAREALALNLCSFSEELFLSCPVRSGESETAPSEIFLYAEQAVAIKNLPALFPYDCSAYGPALLRYFEGCDELEGEKTPEDAALRIAQNSSLREVLMRDIFGHGTPVNPDEMRNAAEKPAVFEAGELYFKSDVSPTLLECYFECPYKSFATRALRLQERDERGVMDSADAGTFVHTVLERAACAFNEIESEEACAAHAREIAEELLRSPKFAALSDTAAGGYTGLRIVEEAASVAKAAYRQLACSNYRVLKTEADISILALKLRGKADRVDASGDSVRIIDYKTGGFDDTPLAYYTGRKLQLQLYLLASANEGSAAGAFYFPAADDFTATADKEGKFRMKGFFCNDPALVKDMDLTREEGKKSDFFEGGGRSEKGMPRPDFDDFLAYSLLVSEGAEREMRAGNVRPSPYDGACKYCKLKGMCGFVGTERKEEGMSCREIAAVSKRAREEEV